MADLLNYYSMNLRDLKKLCISKHIPGITRISGRQQCIDALLEFSKPKKKNNARRRSLTNSVSRSLKAVSHSHSPKTKASRRSRKRSRKDMNEESRTIEPTRSTKRRRTSHPSTMTTPEKAHTIKNPRISPQAQAPKPASMSFHTTDFLSLLDDNSEDEDIEIVDKKGKNKQAPKQKHAIIYKASSPLAVVKASSPEDNELDDDIESEASSTSNNHASFAQRTAYSDGGSSDSESNDESTQSESESDAPPPPKQKIYRRQPIIYDTYDEESKSRSRSQSKPRYRKTANIASSIVNPPRSKSKPKYSRKSSHSQAISIPLHSKNSPITNRRRASLYQSPVRRNPAQVKVPMTPFTPSLMSPKKKRKNKETRCNETESYMMKVVYRIFWVPIQTYHGIVWLLKHLLPICIAIVILSMLYSPTVKMLQSIEFQSVQSTAKNLLQSLRIIPSTQYCDSNAMIEDCKECPENADCIDGYLYCKGERRLIKGECVYDQKEIDKLQNQMETYSAALLSAHRGEYECQQYVLYNRLWNIHEGNENVVMDKRWAHNELAHELSKILQLDATSHLFQQVFAKFTASIKNEDRKNKGVTYDKDGAYYYCTKSYKPFSCHPVIFLTEKRLLIIPSVLVCAVFSVWFMKRRRERKKRLNAKQLTEDRKNDVIQILKNYLRNSEQRWIPIAQIRAQIMGSNAKNKDKEWKRVERLVDRDANIQKSTRMLDGLQKLCWKLSDTALIH